MKNLIYLSFLLLGVLLVSCGDDEPQIGEIADDFTLVGTWNFETVEGDGQIGGIPTNDKDNNPTGFVTFNEDGTGVLDFRLVLLGREFVELDNITWSRDSETEVTIVEGDNGDINEWTLIRGNDGLVEASWVLNLTAVDFATFTAVLTRE